MQEASSENFFEPTTLMPQIALKATANGTGLFAERSFGRDEAVVAFKPVFLNVPTRLTIEVEPGKHLFTEDSPGSFVNHACIPNCRFDRERMAFVAAKPIASGEEITFNYLTTESELASPFECTCGAPNCFGLIRGYRYLQGQKPFILGRDNSPAH